MSYGVGGGVVEGIGQLPLPGLLHVGLLQKRSL